MDINPQENRLNVHPGEWYFGRGYKNIYTILGSCVALTVWHPKLKLGGLCHYLLATPPKGLSGSSLINTHEAGRYAESALLLMKQAMLRYAKLNEYQLGLFGGSDSLADYTVGKQNILYAQRWLENEDLELAQSDTGGAFSRSIVLDTDTGIISLKQYAMSSPNKPL